MANSSLFFRNNRDYKAGNISFDLILNESHNFNNTVTDYNVEDGSFVSDHIRNEKLEGSVTGLITNFSLFSSALISNRSQIVFEKLEQLWRDRELVDIVTVYKVYKNVAITSISISRTNDQGEAIEFEISFKEVNVVKLQSVDIEVDIKLKNMNTDINRQSANILNAGG